MRVGMYYNNTDVRVEEQPVPDIRKTELLVKTIASGICGSDVMEWYRIKKAPLVLGHEITGDIHIVGDEVKEYKPGQRVFVSHHVPCNNCKYCLSSHHTSCETLHRTNFFPGGFSEYIRIPEINIDRGIYLLPDNVSYELGTFIEPLACVIRAQRLAKLRLGQSVLVIGSGISGLLHIQLARNSGATRIVAVDINEFKLKKAIDFGADVAVKSEENFVEQVKEANYNQLFDLVIVCTGVTSVSEQALKCVDRGGKILYFAVPPPDVNLQVPINEFWRNETTIMTSYGASPTDIEIALSVISRKRLKLEQMVTHTFGLSDIGQGFKKVASSLDSIKVIIYPQK